MSPDKYRALLEKLADLEHQQWMEWAENLAAVEVLSASRIARWEKLMVPYDQLTENAKEQDRKWARRIIREIITPGAVEFAQASAKKLGELLAEL